MSKWRAEFPILERAVYLISHSLGAMPRETYDAVREYADVWAARGIVNALTAPLLALSLLRSASWTGHLAVSRRMLFHSAALIGSAVYLLAMSSAAYYLRFVGGSWGTVMQVAFLFGALILLVVILFSGTFRSWLKVFISKHFYSYNYDYREEWLRFTRTLSEHGPGLGQRTIGAVAALVESPGGVLWLRRDHGVCEPETSWNMPVSSASEADDSEFIRFLETRQWVIDRPGSPPEGNRRLYPDATAGNPGRSSRGPPGRPALRGPAPHDREPGRPAPGTGPCRPGRP